MNPNQSAPAEMHGKILAVLPGNSFRVELNDQQLVLATVSSKMWNHWERLVVGDRVTLEMSPHDQTKARITARLR